MSFILDPDILKWYIYFSPVLTIDFILGNFKPISLISCQCILQAYAQVAANGCSNYEVKLLNNLCFFALLFCFFDFHVFK